MDTWLKDLRHALRVLRQNPAFSLFAVAALALGIGANTAIFSVVNAVMLRPVGLPDPDRLVFFMSTAPAGSAPAASPAKFLHWRELNDVVADVSAFTAGVVNYTGGSFPEQLRSGRVSLDFFKLMQAPFARGRSFSADEDLPHGPKAVVISHRLWQTQFNGDPDIIGRSLSLSGEPYAVIGVLGPAVSFRDLGADPDVWVTFQFDPNSADQGHYFTALGRLKPGVALAQAQARVRASVDQFRAKFPDFGAQNGFDVSPVRDVLVRNVRQSLIVLTWAVALVLLIACANVANLLLVRASGRGREIAIRAAIGGSRARLIRQLLTESVALASIGGALGLALGLFGIRALLAINTAGLPRVGENGVDVGLDWRVAAFTLALSWLTGILFGLIPALQSSKVDLTTSLKEGSGRSGTGARHNWTRSVLVVVEAALAVVLLVGSALLIRSAVRLAQVDPGFDATNVLTMRMSLTGPQYRTSEGVEVMIENGIERLKGIPGVERASATCCVPLQGGYGLPFRIAGRPLEDGPFHGGALWTTVSPGYFEVFRIPVNKGRTFTVGDRTGSTPVVIVNEALARQFFPQQDPLGQRLTIGRGVMREFEAEPEREIVGVVGDSRDGGLNADPQPTVFIPQGQVPDAANALNVSLTPMAWVVRTRTDPSALSAAIQEQLRQVAGLPVSQVRSMSDVVLLSTSRQRFNMWLMTVFGAMAMLLAAIGIYGVMAYSVAQRRHEIGIRLALGAQVSAVRGMVVRQGMLLAAAGTVLGLGASFGLARFIADFLFQTTQRDPLVFSGVPVLLLAVAFVAVWIPASRASAVDPVRAMRLD